MISETKIDNSFPLTQFLIEGFKTPYRLDQNGSGGGILVYIPEDIPSKLILTDFSNRKGFFLELTYGKRKGFYVVLIILTATLLKHIWIVLERLLTHSLHDIKILF